MYLKIFEPAPQVSTMLPFGSLMNCQKASTGELQKTWPVIYQ
jgi:hypothetical protein